MLRKVRLEKNWGTYVNERAIYCKILNFFLEKFGNFLVLSKFSYVVPKFPLFFLSGKN